jgi:RNA polymerase sigma-70 factor (ECF subfamily)
MHTCVDITILEKELLELIRQDDKKAFDRIYALYWEKLFLYVAKIIRDEDDAYDIIQDVFVSLWTRRQDLKIEGSLNAYLFSAVRFKTLDYLHRSKRRVLLNLVHEEYPEKISVMEKYSAKELAIQINTRIQELPLKMKEVFLLSRNEEMSHKEISKMLSISDKTVKKQISNALKLLRFKLNL